LISSPWLKYVVGTLFFMKERLAALAEEIRNKYDVLKAKAAQVRSSIPLHKTAKLPLDVSVCAVDGGLLAHRMHGADVVLSRAVGVSFTYSGSKLVSFVHYPEKNPKPEIFIKNSLDEHEALVFRSLIRLKSELSCALSCIEKFSPGIMLIDGSLLPLPSDCPQKESELFALYSEVLALYKKLHEECNGKCILIGVIKDSRSKKFANDCGANCSDTVFCNFLLEESERTGTMPYSESEKSISKSVSVFYIKPSKHDLPLRIETTHPDIEQVASVVHSLSSISESFAYPAVLIEADMCAALDPKEMEMVEASLVSLSGMKPLRRNSRPFR
jgi:hypothetical protein